jgi:hypothetical protein
VRVSALVRAAQPNNASIAGGRTPPLKAAIGKQHRNWLGQYFTSTTSARELHATLQTGSHTNSPK